MFTTSKEITNSDLEGYFKKYSGSGYKPTVITDKCVIDLVNGIRVSKDIDLYLGSRSRVTAIIDFFTGKSSNLNNLDRKNNHVMIESLKDIVVSLAEKQLLSELALVIVERGMIDIVHKLKDVEKQGAINRDRIDALTHDFQDFTKQVSTELLDIRNEMRKIHLEAKVHNTIDFWKPRDSGLYREFPFILQVPLLTRHIASYYLDYIYKQSVDKQKSIKSEISSLLVAAFSADLENNNNNDLKKHKFLDEFLDDSISSMLKNSSVNFTIAEWLMEIRSTRTSRLEITPCIFTIGSALEFTKAKNYKNHKIALESPSELAMALCNMKYAKISTHLNLTSFVKDVVKEVIEDCLNEYKDQEFYL